MTMVLSGPELLPRAMSVSVAPLELGSPSMSKALVTAGGSADAQADT